MSDNFKFESRTGKLTCTAAEVFSFITDIRNFQQFIPEENIKNWQASENDCSFQVPPFGSASVRVMKKMPYSLVEYSGHALKKNDFKLAVNISENERKLADVKLYLTADLNPVLKMMAAEPLNKFMEMLISEMEKFDEWKVI
jgi:carbon monoxide dehydrogenase subunit G